LAYLYNAAIIHSHNRTPAYFFKVNYTDSKLVSQILENPPLKWNANNVGEFFGTIKQLYQKLSHELTIVQQFNSKDPIKIIESLKQHMRTKDQYSDYLMFTDKTIDSLFLDIERIMKDTTYCKPDPLLYNMLINYFIDSLNAFSEYCGNYKTIDDTESDFIATIFKLFASSTASSLGNFVLHLEVSNTKDDMSEILDQFLRKGV
jgi:hypothetical protein